MSRNKAAILNSVRVTIDELETDPLYRTGQHIPRQYALFYAENLEAHFNEISALGDADLSKVARQVALAENQIRNEVESADLSPDAVNAVLKTLQF